MMTRGREFLSPPRHELLALLNNVTLYKILFIESILT